MVMGQPMGQPASAAGDRAECAAAARTAKRAAADDSAERSNDDDDNDDDRHDAERKGRQDDGIRKRIPLRRHLRQGERKKLKLQAPIK